MDDRHRGEEIFKKKQIYRYIKKKAKVHRRKAERRKKRIRKCDALSPNIMSFFSRLLFSPFFWWSAPICILEWFIEKTTMRLMHRSGSWAIPMLTLRRRNHSTALLQTAEAPPTDGLVHRRKSTREEVLSELARDVFSRGCQFLRCSPSLRLLPEGPQSFPEVCFVGEVNSGKSSIIRALCNSEKLGKHSSRAGTTKNLQFFNIADALLLVDTPGFGLYDAPRSRLQRSLGKYIEAQGQALTMQYVALRRHANLRRVYLVIDASKEFLTPWDEFIVSFLVKEVVPFTVLISKMDIALEENYAEAKRRRKMLTKHGENPDGDKHRVQAILTSPPAPQPLLSSKMFFESSQSKLAKKLQELVAPLQSIGDFPILEISANNKFNMDCLACDIVSNCAAELNDDELSFESLTKLSYMASRPGVQIDIERLYSPQVVSQLGVAARRDGTPVPDLPIGRVLGIETSNIKIAQSPDVQHLLAVDPVTSLARLGEAVPRRPSNQMTHHHKVTTGAPHVVSSLQPSSSSEDDTSRPLDISPKNINRLLSTRTMLQQNPHDARVYPAEVTPAVVQTGALGKHKSVERYEAALDGIWGQALNENIFFDDTRPKGFYMLGKNLAQRIEKKYIKMTPRRERAWRTDIRAFAMPFSQFDDHFSVAGTAPCERRVSNAGYAFRGLKQSSIAPYSPCSFKKPKKLHRWARPVTAHTNN